MVDRVVGKVMEKWDEVGESVEVVEIGSDDY